MGAGRFFVEFSFSLFRRSRTAPGRTVTTSGFLLGTVSGSGTATAVTLGSFAWPILQRAGYPQEAAGGMLAASGIGAILSPPTLGAAAFIIAEYLGVSYICRCCSGRSSRRCSTTSASSSPSRSTPAASAPAAVDLDIGSPLAAAAPLRLPLPRRLGVIVFFLALDVPPFRAVVYATGVAAVFGLLEAVLSRRARGQRLRRPRPRARADGARRVGRGLRRPALPGALDRHPRRAARSIAVCAAAGIITSVIAKTGLGQILSDVLVSAAAALSPNHVTLMILSALFAAIAILILGLAVPVTASFILSWVIIGPALMTLGAGAARGRRCSSSTTRCSPRCPRRRRSRRSPRPRSRAARRSRR